MSSSPSVQQLGNNEEDRQGGSPYFPRISGANTVARPSPMQTATDDAFPTVKLQAKMVKQTPLPYQTQEFRPCIVLKKFEPSVRVSDSFVPGIQSRRGAQRVQRKSAHNSQKVRLAQEGQMLQDARSRMRLREALAHRARHDLHLGGSPLAADEASNEEVGNAAAKTTTNQRSKKSHHRRKRHQAEPPQQQQAGKLSFIPEDSSESGRHRRGQDSTSQLVSQSQLRAPMFSAGGAGQSFASRSEYDALAALISADSGAASGAAGHQQQQQQQSELLLNSGFPGSSGLEKVKLDGSKAVFNRRSDILTEIARLKAIVLPDFAKDLFVGRGIRLPESHALNNPKKTLAAGDPVLDALLHQAQQPSRIIDESGNVLIASSGDSQQQQQPKRQVFAADVTAKPNVSTESQPKPKTDNGSNQTQQQPPPQEQLESLEEEQKQQPEPTDNKDVAKEEQEEPMEPLPEPFLGLPSEWMRNDADVSGKIQTDEGNIQEQIKRLDLPPALTGYLLAIFAASSHARAAPLSLELGRLIGQRLLLTPESFNTGGTATRSLIGWLRRGLDLFHDVDREVKGSVSLIAFLDILSSMRGMPLDNEEMSSLQSAFGLHAVNI
uniref:Protein kinase domain-containing protein n=1 Tax=Macrostomum lignano TaxID=282301 RepID=A0A1I8H498_9PLAT